MAIDPNIILSLNKNPGATFDPMTFFRAKEAAELGRAREQQNALALQENERKVAAEQLALAQEEELKNLYAQGGTRGEVANRLFSAGKPTEAFAVEKGVREGELHKIDSATKQRNHIKALLEDGIARPDLPNVMGIIDRAEADFGVDLSNERQTLMQLPTDEERKLYLMRLNLPVEKQLPTRKTEKYGTYALDTVYDPLTQKPIGEPTRTTIHASPESQLVAKTAANELQFKKDQAASKAEAPPKPMTWQEEKYRRQVALEEEKKGLSAEAKVRKFTDTMDSVDNLLGTPGDPEKGISATPGRINALTSGFGGMALAYLSGTPAFDVKESLKPILASLGFDELEAMREASKTGGALGQVAVKELGFLQGRVKSLEQAQSPKQLRDNLNTVRKHYQRWKDLVGSDKFKKEQAKQGGGAAPAGGGGYSDPDKEKRYQEYVRSRGG